jgi:hypothetical protein
MLPRRTRDFAHEVLIRHTATEAICRFNVVPERAEAESNAILASRVIVERVLIG